MRRTEGLPVLALLLAACEGGGSDIGPRLPPLPDASSKVVVLDDERRGVVGAVVTIDGTQIRAVSGPNGRGDFLAAPRGRVVVQVDGSSAAAVAGDRLALLRVATTIVGPDLPTPIHLPDLPEAAQRTVTAGSQATTTVVPSVRGSTLTIQAGTSVGGASGASDVPVRLGELRSVHLPGDLPSTPTETRLFGRGVFVDPGDVTFAPGAVLDVADDIAVGTAVPALFRLDPVTGEWQASTATVTVAGGRLSAAVDAGGLYSFGVVVPSTEVSGRVVNVAGDPVFDAMVRVDHVRTQTGGDGRFTAVGVPATMGDDSARQAQIEVVGGGTWLPVGESELVAVSQQPADFGDLLVDTLRAGNIRVQQVVRARAESRRLARLSTVRDSFAFITTSDDNGQVLYEDVPAGFIGFQEARRRSDIEVFYGQSVGVLAAGNRWQDIFQFLFARRWFEGARSVRCYVSDAVGVARSRRRASSPGRRRARAATAKPGKAARSSSAEMHPVGRRRAIAPARTAASSPTRSATPLPIRITSSSRSSACCDRRSVPLTVTGWCRAT